MTLLSADRPARSDEAGTAPSDRRFRPDVEGLRAVAVALVVLYHAGLPGLGGGYVGVDVFFVISGFVITGVLLRERASGARTSLITFYGRRARRIIPAASLVIVVTVVASYALLSVVYGNQTAVDARWTSVFLANFHFASTGTNYLSAQQPPSLLLNFWSLAVEEQFYLVYPTVFLLLSVVRVRWSLQARLAATLAVVVGASFALSVAQTASNPTVAYFSPFTRAWELGIGALVAVGTTRLHRLGGAGAALMTWVGLAAIAGAAVGLNGHSPYPGALAAIPVGGAALVIAGGVATPRRGAEALLGLSPFRWLGRLSYSLYLWHWPILIMAADAAGRSSLPFHRNVIWLVVAVGAAELTFHVVENPVRHADFVRFGRFGRLAPIALGIVLIATTLTVATVELSHHSARDATPDQTITPAQVAAFLHANVATDQPVVQRAVEHAPSITSLPPNLTPSLAGVLFDFGGPRGACWPPHGAATIPPCVFGDVHGAYTMVVYGDSHAGQWLSSLSLIGRIEGWKVVYLGKGDCPAASLHYANPPGWGAVGGEYRVCDQWHRFAVGRINAIHPDLVVITEEFRGRPDGVGYTAAQWTQGLATTIRQIHLPASHVAVLGNTPTLPQNGPQCLSLHPHDVQACSAPLAAYQLPYLAAEHAAATETGAEYIDTVPWFCSTTCTAVIDKFEVYWDDYHITGAYATYLSRVLAEALHLSPAPWVADTG